MTNPLYDRLFAIHAGSDRPFLIRPNGSQISYTDFLRRGAQFAQALRILGVSIGDRVAVQIDKSTDALALYTGCVQAGAVFLPLNTAYTGAELEYFINDSGPALVVCTPANAHNLVPIAKRNGVQLATLGTDGDGSLADLVAGQDGSFETVARDGSDLAALLYTSGTTGRSKGAMLSQDNLLSNALVLAEHWRFEPDDVLLHALPIFHTHGLFVATNISLAVGSSMIFLPGFDQEALIRLMPKATSLMGVPTFYTRLLNDARLTKDLTTNMRLFISGSAPLLAETHKAFEAATGHRILERYGMTETNMNSSNPYEGDRRAGTVGFPLPGVEIEIRDPDSGALLPVDTIGSIEVRGANVFQGYWNMPEKTAEELRDTGFFITGDLGKIDDDGYLHIVGRGKDLIISGGFNIYPKEVELVLDDLPGVLESAVIGAPHPDFGEGVVAVLVAEKDTLDLDQIRGDVASKLAKFKQPKHYVIMPELPRNTMGKVQKNVLRDAQTSVFQND